MTGPGADDPAGRVKGVSDEADPERRTGPEAAGTPTLGRSAARGALVTTGGQIARLLMQTVSVVVLARLLDPGDYGLVAMGLVVVGIGEIFRDFGLSSAAIQSPELSIRQRDNLFWINSAIGLCLTCITFFAAPAIAWLFHRDEVQPIVRAIAVVFLLNGLATQYRASLLRSLRFGAVAIADTVSVAIGFLVAVVSALSGWGYWALVVQVLTQAGVVLTVSVGVSRWWPHRPRRDPGMPALLRFGWHLVGAQVLNFAGNNADTVLIGARFGAIPLGLYNRAYQLVMRPLVQLLAPSSSVAIPVLSRLRGDEDRFQRFLLRGQAVLGYGAVVGLAWVAATALPITTVALGPKWESAAPLLALLAVAGALQTLAYVGYWVYVSRGLTVQLRRYSLFSATLRVTCVVVGSRWGVVGVAAGMVASPAIAWPVSIWWLSRFAPIPTRQLLQGALRIIAVATLTASPAAVIVRSMGPLSPWLSLLLSALAAFGVLALLSLVSRPVRTDLLSVLEIVGRAVRR